MRLRTPCARVSPGRADVRAATGKISIETTAAGETVSIPEAGGANSLPFCGRGELCTRENLAKKTPGCCWQKVKTSDMKMRQHATM